MQAQNYAITTAQELQGFRVGAEKFESCEAHVAVAATIVDSGQVGDQAGGFSVRRHISLDHVLWFSLQPDLTIVDPHGPGAEVLDRSHVVRDKHNGSSTAAHFIHDIQA